MTEPLHLEAPILRGERVYLRAPERSDVPAFVRWFNDSLTTSFIMMRSPMSTASEEQWFEQMLKSEGKDAYHFVISLIEDGRAIGNLGLFEIDLVNGHAGIGITIGEKELWGQGYGTDAMNVLVDFGFGMLRLERLWLDVYDFNLRARRSYEKAGFVVEGTRRHEVVKRGRYHDAILMSILRDEWQALPRRSAWDFDKAEDGPPAS